VEGEPHAHITGLSLSITTPEELSCYMRISQFGERTIKKAIDYWKRLEAP